MLSLLPLAFLSAPCTLQSGEAPGVVRLYDVRSASPIEPTWEHSLVLLPLLRNYDDEYPSTLGHQFGGESSLVVSFLRGLDPPQWEYEGREINTIDDGRLHVFAPVALQDVVSRALVFLEDTVARPVTFVVDLVSFGPNPGIGTLPPLLPASEVSRWTAIGTGHESYELTIRPGEMGNLCAERTVSFALDSRLHIAERATAFHLDPEQIAVGTAIDLASAPGPSGSWVALALRNGRFLDSEATRDELLRTTTTTDQANIVTEHQRLRSDPRLANHSLAVNAFLPDGKALAFVTSAGLESRVVFVRQTGVTPPPTVSLPEDLKRVTSRSATMLVRTDGVNLPQVQVDPRPEMPHLLNPWRSLDDGNPLVLAAIGRSWTVDAQAVLGHSGEDYETLDLGAYVALMGSTRESIERAIARFLQNAPVPQSLAVTLTLRRGTREPAALARAVVPLRVGVPSVVVVGRESVADLVASPEVATGSSGIDTEIGRLFDGIAVSVALGAGAGGTLTLVVDAHARWSRVAPRDFESGGAISARLQLPDADMLDVRRTVVLAKADGGPRKVTLGNAGTSAEALTLDVEVVDLR